MLTANDTARPQAGIFSPFGASKYSVPATEVGANFNVTGQKAAEEKTRLLKLFLEHRGAEYAAEWVEITLPLSV